MGRTSQSYVLKESPPGTLPSGQRTQRSNKSMAGWVISGFPSLIAATARFAWEATPISASTIRITGLPRLLRRGSVTTASQATGRFTCREKDLVPQNLVMQNYVEKRAVYLQSAL